MYNTRQMGQGCAHWSAYGTGGGHGWVGMRAKNKFVYPKWVSPFWLYSNFISPPEEYFFGFGWGGRCGRVGGSARPPHPLTWFAFVCF